MSRVWVVIAGGGTAGHVLPGVSIADEMTRRGVWGADVHFVGSVGGAETRLVVEAGFTLTTLPGRGLRRRFSPRSVVSNMAAVFEFARACVQALLLLRQLKPAVVVGLGGYASVPCGLAAALLRVPLVITEQNAVPGMANRLLSRFCVAAATAFAATELKGAVHTGNPLRREVIAVADTAKSATLSVSGKPEGSWLLAVLGGSLGARSINQAVVGALELWGDRQDLRILHIAGPRHFNDVQQTLSQRLEHGPAHDLIAYSDDMAAVYAAADLVVARAGATTVAELAAAGKPSVLIPLPGAPGDHQTANARVLESAGGAVIVHDRDLTAAHLVSQVDALLADPQRLAVMAESARKLAKPDAAEAVVDLIESHARRPHRPATADPATADPATADHQVWQRRFTSKESSA